MSRGNHVIEENFDMAEEEPQMITPKMYLERISAERRGGAGRPARPLGIAQATPDFGGLYNSWGLPEPYTRHGAQRRRTTQDECK